MPKLNQNFIKRSEVNTIMYYWLCIATQREVSMNYGKVVSIISGTSATTLTAIFRVRQAGKRALHEMHAPARP
jgi:hypothetical protein